MTSGKNDLPSSVLLEAAVHALRAYQFGNGSPDLAKDIADQIESSVFKLELEDACRLVENVARSLGKDCQIIFIDRGVSVAPASWAGDSTGKTLFDALTDARKSL